MKILMCRPDYYDVEYEINPWMDMGDQPDRELALQQWQKIYDTYRKLGVEIKLIKQVKGLPDMVFVANGGIVYGNKFICSNHKYQERKGEEKQFQQWFASHEFTVHTLNWHQGGEGDALFYRDTLYMGYGFRSEIESHTAVGKILGVNTVSLQLIDPRFYDFDTAFCSIGNRAVLYYAHAFDEESRRILQHLPNAYPMNHNHAAGFVGNSVLIGDTLLVGYLDSELEKILRQIDIKPLLFNMSEFKKSGGGIKCLTLYLER